MFPNKELCEKVKTCGGAFIVNHYKKLHLYADGAHGFGRISKNGRGYILSQIAVHPKIILAASFSGPHQIPLLGAGIASAKFFYRRKYHTDSRSFKRKSTLSRNYLKGIGFDNARSIDKNAREYFAEEESDS